MKKLLSITTAILCTMMLSGISIPVWAASTTTGKNFTFSNGSMTKEVLRNYCSRAVTCAGFCAEGLSEDPIFEEDLRMLRRIGAKYIGRAAYYSWSGNMSTAQIEQHYAAAKAKAELAHKADPEMILQAGVFEIIYKGTVNNTAIPKWVFEAFGQAPVTRNFRYEDMLFPSTHKYYTGFWGNSDSAVPNITKTETQMYFYYQICRYIDSGFEAVHLGQAELMADNISSNYQYWDTVTTLARAYAEDHARRGIILFDCHSAITSNGMKIGNRLICDIQGAGIVPNETKYENGAYKCEISDYKQNWLQWIGRSAGGQHPLGFTVDNNFTILEFDNYGGNGSPNLPTYEAFYNWGYDDVTWFAMQPEWYRNQFLLECDTKLKSIDLDSEGKQQYFLQPSCRRCLTATPSFTYTISKNENTDYVMEYLDLEKTSYTIDTKTNKLTLKVTKDYRCNKQSDACPNGFNQEDTIRQVFLGANAPEDPSLTGYIIPGKNTITTTKANAANGTTTSSKNTGTAATIANSISSSTAAAMESNSSSLQPEDSNEGSTGTVQDDVESQGEDVDNTPKKNGPLFMWILIIGGIILLAGITVGLWLWKFRK